MFFKNNIYKFNNLSSYPDLVHGFSTRFFGSMRPKHEESKASIAKFASQLEIPAEKIVTMGQKHTNNVYQVTEKDWGQSIPDIDSLFTQDQDVFLGVVTADCIPLLMYDPKKKAVAAIHAGWRGLFNEIIKETVSSLVAVGSNPQDILVGIGPCIRVCSYDISQDHANVLIEKFPDWKPFVVEREEKLFLDLPGIATHQLKALGIKIENIEDAEYCTFDHTDVYSRRREGDDFGEIMGIIGMQDK